MRNVQNVSKSESKWLTTLFPDLIEVGDPDYKGYEHSSICVFEHWLTREECYDEIDNVTAIKAFNNDAKLYHFCVELTNTFTCYSVKFQGHNKLKASFRKFTSLNGAKNHLKVSPYNYGSRSRFVLVIPEIKVIYIEDCDFTHHIYYKKGTDITPLINLATKCSLFHLEKL